MKSGDFTISNFIFFVLKYFHCFTNESPVILENKLLFVIFQIQIYGTKFILPQICCLFNFHLITYHLESQGFFLSQIQPLFFFSASVIMCMSTCFQNSHFIQSIQWKKKSVKSVARFPVDKTSSWLTRYFSYQLFVLALFRHSLCLLFFSFYWICSNCFCILFFGILLASSFQFSLFK